MKTEIMSGAGLSAYAELALILFALAFAAIVWRTFAPRFKADLEARGRLPLDDQPTPPPAAPARGTES